MFHKKMDISALQQNLKIAAAVLLQWRVQDLAVLCFIGIVDWERRAKGVGFVVYVTCSSGEG